MLYGEILSAQFQPVPVHMLAHLVRVHHHGHGDGT
jgi:hypothetical protein